MTDPQKDTLGSGGLGINYEQHAVSSDQLIAEAYAAVKSTGKHGEPPAPVGSPIALDTTAFQGQAESKLAAASASPESTARKGQVNTYQPPAPTGSPVQSLGGPLPVTKEAPRKPVGTTQARPAPNQRQTTPPKQQKRTGGCATSILWLFVLFIVYVLVRAFN